MRNYIIALPILALSACSALEQPYLPSASNASYGEYSQGCSAGTCAPGQSYSVAGQEPYSVNANHWPDKKLVPAYESGGAYGHGPVHVNPTGYGHGGHGYGPGHAPALRGGQYGKRGNFYGTLGGVMYDTDIDSFGLEGRLGYDSGRYWGAEVEGSVGLIDEKSTESGVDLKSGFDYNVAAFAVARLPLGDRFSVHARGGYDFRKLSVTGEDVNGNRAKATVDLDGIAYGVGAEYALSPRSGLRLDFTEYRGGDDIASQSVSASFVRKF